MTQEEAEVKLKVNSKAAQEELDRLEKKASTLREKFRKAFEEGDTKGIKEITKELDKTNRQITNMRTNAANIQAAMKRLNEASPKELQRTIKMINAELSSGRVPRGSKEWREYTEQLKRAKAELKRVNSELVESKGLLSQIKDKFNDWGASAAAGIAAFTGLVLTGKQAVQAYADMQQEEANVQKYTGMTEEQVKSLNDEFKKIDTRTSREELNKLAQEAGRLGKQSQEDVLGFVKAANQINVSLDELGEGATLTLSKLTGIFGDEERLGTEKSLLAVGSVINELSQNCTASAPYLADFSKRLAGVGAQAKMTIPQIMSFAAVLDTQGQAVEMSATAFSTLILKLYQDPAKFATAAKLDVKEFSDLLKKDANEAVITLLESLNKMGNINALAPIFQDMGMDGARASGVLAALAGNIDQVRQQQEVANVAFAEATSITKEYDVQNNTVQASLDKAKKGFTEMAVTLGEKLLPVMKYCVSGTTAVMKTLLALISFVTKFKGELIALTATLVAYKVAVEAATIKTKALAVWQAVCTARTKAWAVAQQAWNVVAAAATLKTHKLSQEFKLLATMLKTSSWGLAIGLIGAMAVAIVSLTKKTDQYTYAQRKLNEIRKTARDNAQQEIQGFERLAEAARNESLSLEERTKAINHLNQIVPNYNGHLDATTGKYIENKKALDDYIASLVKAYEIQGAEDQLAELGRKKVEINQQIREMQREEAKINAEITAAAQNAQPAASSSANMPGVALGAIGRSGDLAAVRSKLKDLNSELERTKQLETDITTLYGQDMQRKAIANVDSQSIPSADPGSGGGEPKSMQDVIKERLEAEKSLIDKEQAINAVAYATGERDYEAYVHKKQMLDMGLLDNQISALEELKATDSNEYADLWLKRKQLQDKFAEENKAKSLADLEAQYDEQKDLIIGKYLDANSVMYLNDKAYKQALLEAEINFLKKKLKLHKDNAKERAKVEKQIAGLIYADQMAKAKETKEKREQFEKQYLSGRFGAYKESLDKIDQLEQDGVISAKEATHARMQELAKELSSLGQDFSAALVNLGDTIFAYINDLGANMGDIVSASFGLMASALSQYSQLANAERDLEIAKIEKRYDAEIEAAGKNQKKVEQLEKKKEAEIAATKKKYNDRSMKIELAQAVAQTAQAAIAAYASAAAIPVTGWIMAPIAASLATAAGMLQIATIKKQHEAEAAGYYEGGYTGGKNYRKEAGVVHEGEFVMNHEAVNNPSLAPLLRIIDSAQRTNTVAQLSAEDVSKALGQGVGVSARGEVAGQSAVPTIIANDIDTSPIERLNDILSDGIAAWIPLDGENGFDRQYTRYKRLKDNSKR